MIFGTNNVHFVDSDGTKILEIATTTNESNISITNEGFIPATILNKFTVTTFPILVYLNSEINCDDTNINKIISPRPFKLLDKYLIISFPVFICFVTVPYIIEQIININDVIYKIPFTNGEFAPNNLFTYIDCDESSNAPDKGNLGMIAYTSKTNIIIKAINAFLNALLSNFSLSSISSEPILTGFLLAIISVIIEINNANNKLDITTKNKFPE